MLINAENEGKKEGILARLEQKAYKKEKSKCKQKAAFCLHFDFLTKKKGNLTLSCPKPSHCKANIIKKGWFIPHLYIFM